MEDPPKGFLNGLSKTYHHTTDQIKAAGEFPNRPKREVRVAEDPNPFEYSSDLSDLGEEVAKKPAEASSDVKQHQPLPGQDQGRDIGVGKGKGKGKAKVPDSPTLTEHKTDRGSQYFTRPDSPPNVPVRIQTQKRPKGARNCLSRLCSSLLVTFKLAEDMYEEPEVERQPSDHRPPSPVTPPSVVAPHLNRRRGHSPSTTASPIQPFTPPDSPEGQEGPSRSTLPRRRSLVTLSDDPMTATEYLAQQRLEARRSGVVKPSAAPVQIPQSPEDSRRKEFEAYQRQLREHEESVRQGLIDLRRQRASDEWREDPLYKAGHVPQTVSLSASSRKTATPVEFGGGELSMSGGGLLPPSRLTQQEGVAYNRSLPREGTFPGTVQPIFVLSPSTSHSGTAPGSSLSPHERYTPDSSRAPPVGSQPQSPALSSPPARSSTSATLDDVVTRSQCSELNSSPSQSSYPGTPDHPRSVSGRGIALNSGLATPPLSTSPVTDERPQIDSLTADISFEPETMPLMGTLQQNEDSISDSHHPPASSLEYSSNPDAAPSNVPIAAEGMVVEPVNTPGRNPGGITGDDDGMGNIGLGRIEDDRAFSATSISLRGPYDHSRCDLRVRSMGSSNNLVRVRHAGGKDGRFPAERLGSQDTGNLAFSHLPRHSDGSVRASGFITFLGARARPPAIRIDAVAQAVPGGEGGVKFSFPPHIEEGSYRGRTSGLSQERYLISPGPTTTTRSSRDLPLSPGAVPSKTFIFQPQPQAGTGGIHQRLNQPFAGTRSLSADKLNVSRPDTTLSTAVPPRASSVPKVPSRSLPSASRPSPTKIPSPSTSLPKGTAQSHYHSGSQSRKQIIQQNRSQTGGAPPASPFILPPVNAPAVRTTFKSSPSLIRETSAEEDEREK